MDSFFSSRPISPQNPTIYSPIFRRAFSSGYGDPYATYRSARMAMRTIIGLNTLVFGTWTYAGYTKDSQLLRWLTQNFTLSRHNFQSGRYWTMLTSAFSHQNFVHFLFNMLAFQAFGSILAFAPGIGAMHVVSLCIGSAISGSFAFLYDLNYRNPPRKDKLPSSGFRGPQPETSALGASGMVMGAGLAATCLMPEVRMALLFPPIPMPLWVLMGLYVGIDFYFLGDGRSRIGHSAHLGGAIYGGMYYLGYLRNYGGVWLMLRRMFRR